MHGTTPPNQSYMHICPWHACGCLKWWSCDSKLIEAGVKWNEAGPPQRQNLMTLLGWYHAYTQWNAHQYVSSVPKNGQRWLMTRWSTLLFFFFLMSRVPLMFSLIIGCFKIMWPMSWSVVWSSFWQITVHMPRVYKFFFI